MQQTLHVWNALVDLAKRTGVFQDVRRYPMARIKDAAFFQDIPDLKLPACLIVMKDRRDQGDSPPVARTTRWSAIAVAQDAAGDAEELGAALVDALGQLVGKEILDGDIWIPASNDLASVECPAGYSLYELAFSTREEIVEIDHA